MRFIKTETGQQAFKERSPLFSARQRSMFIMFDGQKTVEQIVVATAGLGVTQADVDAMVEHGFLAPAAGEVAATIPVPLTSTGEPVSQRSDQDRYKDAKPLATQLTASLGLRGFRLNMAVESAVGYADLLKLFPKIQEAVGAKAAQELERALKG
jgi:hypothetical protein